MPQTLSRRYRISALMGVIGLALAVSLALPSLAFADPTSAEKQAEAQSALATLNTMQEKLDQASANHWTALEEQQVATENSEAAQVRIDEASAQIAESQDRLGARARSMYRAGESTFLDLLLGSTTFQAFATNWDILNKINENDSALVQQTKDLRAEVEEQKAVYDEQQKIAKEKADEAKRIEDEAASTVSAMQATYNSLSAEAAALLEDERAAQEAARAASAQETVDQSAAGAGNATNNSGGGNAGNTNSGGGNSGGSSTPAPSPSSPPYSPVTGNAIVDRAYGCLGMDYNYGSVGPNAFDCSGLVSYAILGSYSRLGSTYTFMNYPRVSDPQPGDIATNWNHCGIYIGGGQMIHASTYGVGVIQSAVYSDMIIVRPR